MDEPKPPPGTNPPAGFTENDAFATPRQIRQSRMERRRSKIVSEIQRNRRGEYAVPTWVLTTILVVIIAAIAIFMIFAGR